MSYNGLKKRLPKRRRFIRRRFLALALMILLGIVLMWLPYLVPAEWLRRTVETELTNALGSPVRLEGIRLRGWSSVELRRLTIGHSENPLAVMPQSRARISLRGLMRGRIELRKIQLVEPSISLVRNYDGAWNFEKLLQSEGSEIEGRITLPEISVSDASVRVADLSDGSESRVTGVNIELVRDFAEDAYGFGLRGVLDRPGNPLAVSFRGNIQVRLFQIPVGTGGVMALNNASLSVGYPNEDMRIAMRNGSGAVYWDQFGMRATIQLSLLDDRIWMSYSDLGPADGVRTALFRIQGPSLRIDRLTSFVIEYFPVKPSDTPRPRTSSIPIALLAGLKGQYDIAFGEIGTPEWRFSDLRAVLGANNGVIRAHQVNMRFNQGYIETTGRFDVTGDKPTWQFSTVARQVEPLDNLQPMLKDVLPVINMTEPFDVIAEMSGVGLEDEDLWESMRGYMNVGLRAGKIEVGEVPAYIQRLFPLMDPTDLRFAHGKIDSRVRGQSVEFEARFYTQRIDGVDSFARGKVDLKERWVDLDFGVDMLSTLGARLRPESDLFGKTDIALFRVRGEFAKPAVLEWYQIAAQGVAGLVKQILWDDPIALINPNMSIKEKAEYFRGRIQTTLGVAVRPLLLVGDGAKSLLDGAYGETRRFINWLIGAGGNGQDKE